MTARNLWVQAFEHFHRSWRQVLLTHLAFTAIGIVLFAPLIGLTGRLLLRLSDQPALADQDIAYFLLSPFGMFALILFAALLITILAFEQAALMRIGIGLIQGHRISILQAGWMTASRVNRLFLFSAHLVARVLALTLPFLAVAGVVALIFITDYDINYYLSKKPPEFWKAVVLIGLTLIVMAVLLVHKLAGWFLSLPLVLFGGMAPGKSFHESVQITRGHRRLILATLAIWAGTATVLSIAAFGVVRLLGSWTVPGFSDSLTALVVLLGGLSALWMVANTLVTTFSSGTLAYLIAGMFQQFGPAVEEAESAGQSAGGGGTLRLTPRHIVLGLIGGIVVAGLAGVWLVHDIQPNDEVTIVAHRGAAGKAPENTLAAVHQAIEDRADWVEIDVQESADGEIIVFHDSDFMKLADNAVKVWDATLQQMREIDVGSWFDTGFSDQTVPTLVEVLDAVRGKAKLVIELKYYGHDQQLEQRVVDIVEAANMVDDTAIMSLKYDAVTKMLALRPAWNIGLLSATAIGDLTGLDADFLAVAQGMASRGFVKRAHEAGKQVFVWTVNDPVSMSRMMSLGVDGIITDEPEMARQVLADRAELTSVERLLLHAATLFGKSFTPRQYRDESP